MIRHTLTVALAVLLATASQTALAAEHDIAARLAAADPANGEKVFRKCRACHTVEKDGANRVGPNLWGVVGREVATAPDYSYSDGLKAHGGEWAPERLDIFLTDPKGTVPGTGMTFPGLTEAGDRADLIAWLNTMSDEPLDLTAADAGEASPTADEGPAGDAEPSEFGMLKVAEGVETTYYACTACHSEMIVAQQGLTRDDWDELLDWMVEEQGMSELDTEERTVVLDYLAAHYNVDRPNFPN